MKLELTENLSSYAYDEMNATLIIHLRSSSQTIFFLRSPPSKFSQGLKGLRPSSTQHRKLFRLWSCKSVNDWNKVGAGRGVRLKDFLG